MRCIGARTVIRADVTQRKTVTNADMLPGTPPDGGSIDTVDIEVANVSRVIDGRQRNYITTPKRCPSDRRWIATVSFTYADGVTQTMPTASKCSRPSRRSR